MTDAFPSRGGASSDPLACLREQFAAPLKQVNARILSSLDSLEAPIIARIAGRLLHKGKRVRPLVTLAAAQALRYGGEKHLCLAAAIELIHAATLLHDDVLDHSSLRRGAKTANAIWGNQHAILIGDYLFSMAFAQMVASQSIEALKLLADASRIITEGELLQLSARGNPDIKEDCCMKIIEAKTAALFAAAAEAGAVIANAAKHHRTALRCYGFHLGIAYQLKDDILDYSGNAKKIGKSIGDDLKEGKMTLALLYALHAADRSAHLYLTRIIRNKRATPDQISKAVAIVKSTGALEKTVAAATHHTRLACRALDALEESSARSALHSMACTILERSS